MSEYTGGVAKTVSMFSKLMNQGSQLVVEGVNFVLKENVSGGTFTSYIPGKTYLKEW